MITLVIRYINGWSLKSFANKCTDSRTPPWVSVSCPFCLPITTTATTTEKMKKRNRKLFFYFLRIRSFPATSWAKGAAFAHEFCGFMPRLLGAKIISRNHNNNIINNILSLSAFNTHNSVAGTDDAVRRMSSVVPYYIQDTGGPSLCRRHRTRPTQTPIVTRGGGQYDDYEDDDRNNEWRGGGGRRRARAAD